MNHHIWNRYKIYFTLNSSPIFSVIFPYLYMWNCFHLHIFIIKWPNFHGISIFKCCMQHILKVKQFNTLLHQLPEYSIYVFTLLSLSFPKAELRYMFSLVFYINYYLCDFIHSIHYLFFVASWRGSSDSVSNFSVVSNPADPLNISCLELCGWEIFSKS